MRASHAPHALLAPLLAACRVLAGCGDDDQDELADVAGEEAADVDAPEIDQVEDGDDVEEDAVVGVEVLEDPAAYEDLQVTVRAPVDRTIGARAVELGAEAPAEPLLALSEDDVEIEDGEVVDVTGVVRQVVPDTFEDDFGHPFDPTWEDFEGRYALDVEEIEVAEAP